MNEPDAFAGLYQSHVRQVYAYLLGRVGNVEDAQDLTSQTFLAALQNRRSYREEQPVAAWLFGIARNKAADLFRQRRLEVELETVAFLPDGNEPVEELVARRLTVEQLACQLQTLTPDRADAIALRFLAGFTAADIAQIMDKNEAAVRMLLFRGLHDLQQRRKPARVPEPG